MRGARLNHAAQSVYFGVRERAIGACGEIFEREVADFYALDFFHGMAGLEQAVAQRVAASFGERDFVPRGVFAFDARDARASGLRQAFDFFEGEESFQFQIVGLRQVMGFEHQVR